MGRKIFIASLLVLLFVTPPFILAETKYETISLRFSALQNLNQLDSGFINDPRNALIASIRAELFLEKIPFSTNQNSTCERDLNSLTSATSRSELWALKVFDAWGTTSPSGLLKGNIFWLGNYDECVDLLYQANNKSFIRQPFDTQYCALQSKPTQPVEVRADLTLGLCLPASCNRQSIITLLQSILNVTDLTRDHIHCSNDRVNEANSHWMGTLVLIAVLLCLATIVSGGTIIDIVIPVYHKRKIKEKLLQHEYHNLSKKSSIQNNSRTSADQPSEFVIIQSPIITFLGEFSAIRTIRRIFTINTKNDDGSILCLNGIRVLSLFWVILGHSFSSGAYYASNLIDMQIAQRSIVLHVITRATCAVDTFFVLSGLLTVVAFVRQVRKEQLTPRLMIFYYIHRYIRLTPTFILVMLISVYLTPYFGRGPLYPVQQGFEPDKCRAGNWWTAFLYIGNFLKSDDLCLNITWYLYNDMQFHWIAPLALVPFVKGKKIISYVIILLFVFISVGSILGILLYHPSFSENNAGFSSNITGPNFSDVIYMAPWCRIGAYAIGLFAGFLMINTNRNYRINHYTRMIGTLIAIILAVTSIFWNYPSYVSSTGLSRTSTFAYQILSRPMWSIAILWLIFLCSIGQGGIVNRILSLSLWLPLARLNYAAYLIHTIVIYITVFNQSNPLYYQFMTCLSSYVSHLIFSYIAAIIVVIFLETPFFILEKRLFKR